MISYNPRDPVIDRAAHVFDPANPRSYRRNVVPTPTDLFAWAGSAATNNCTLSRDATAVGSPAGGTPLKMAVTGNDSYAVTYGSSSWTLAPAAAGQTWTISVYAKASQTVTAQLFIFEIASDQGTLTRIHSADITVGTSWTRISLTVTFSESSTRYIQARLDGTSTSGDILWFDGLQVEQGSAPSTFDRNTNINGATFTDLSASAVAATMYGPVRFINDAGGCWDFGANTTPGNESFQSYASTLGFTLPTLNIPRTGNYAFSAWVKDPAVVGGSQPVIFGNAGGGDGFRFGADASGMYALVGPPYNEGNYLFSFAANTWYHCMVVADRTGVETGSPRILFYLNGSQVGFLPLTFPQVRSHTEVPGIVRTPSSSGSAYRGKLGLFAAYAGHVSPQEVQMIFASQRGRYGV